MWIIFSNHLKGRAILREYCLLEDKVYMKKAIEEAKKAEAIGEVPIGAVIVQNGAIISSGYNERETKQRPTAHAELIAIEKASEALGTWRLNECTLYVTLEPCPMCSGAIVQSRVGRVVFGASDPKGGCCGTLMNLVQDERFNHCAELTSGVYEKECGELLSHFFRMIRKRKKKKGNVENEK